MSDSMDIRPQDLPKLRAEVIQEVRSRGPRIFEKVKPRGYQRIAPAGYIVGQEVRRLQAANLYYVSPEMGALAKTAGLSLPYFTVQPEDCPSPYGIVFFAGPRLVYTLSGHGDQDVTLRALGWGLHTHPQFGPGIQVTKFVDTAEMRESAASARTSTRTRRGKESSWYNYRGTITYDFDGEFFWPFTPDPTAEAEWTERRFRAERTEEEQAFIGDHSGDYKWHVINDFASSCLLRSTWLLMQQPLAEVSDATADASAPAAKPGKASKPRKSPTVRVIDLRRPTQSSGDTGESGREYHHQWIVCGHWRQQWYPARQVHRPVWIAPHVKGPEGAPMIGGEKVYAWKR